MPDTMDPLKLAHQRRREGRLREAAEIVREVLRGDHQNTEALHLLAVVAHQLGKHEYAYRCAEHAVRSEPKNSVYHCTLGVISRCLNRPDAAIDCYRRAIRLAPVDATSHFNLGNALRDKGRHDDAIRAYKHSLRLDPLNTKACYNLGLSLQATGKLEEAIVQYERAIELKPDYVDVRIDLGSVLAYQGKHEAARSMYKQALRYDPRCGEAYNNLGNLYRLEGKHRAALLEYRNALKIDPKNATVWSSVGEIRLQHNQYAEAINSFRRAIMGAPRQIRHRCRLADAFYENGQMREAITAYSDAIERQPNCAPAYLGRAYARLIQGDYELGWQDYEWRLQLEPICRVRPTFIQPEWDGTPLVGQSLLVYDEPGFGNTFQFSRYLQHIERDSHSRVAFACSNRLGHVMKTCPGIDVLAHNTGTLSNFDLQLPLHSLARVLPLGSSIPNKTPYLDVPAEEVGVWRSHLGGIDGFRIGIAWQGDPYGIRDKRRSFSVQHFREVASIDGVSLVSLQKGPGTEQLAHLQQLDVIVPSPKLDESSAFADTAAVMKNLDLVITADTSVAHLAGALGVRTWLALPKIPDWRWGLEGESSVWYPTMRLFRQQTHGDWQSVFKLMRDALKREL